ncbi:hypothetical protein FOA43_004606 [Brettanomyces nanus]|uniref:High osmolarity signaling protein SHO1 n=1 Tax=Eeniella nana TaxID=13502 RepID=A0A875SCL7_EENNA|nr:uncharacterized protein FOA43_004606 [Brettanomyces nanus]QPG77199.1 hypothetical protein FOA43_004606 [Brettanomyces nanus]
MATSRFKSLNIFAVSTYGISIVAWIIAFAGSIAASTSLNDYYPKFSWWSIVFQLLLLIFLPVLYVTGSLHYYRIFLTCCIAIAFIYNTNSTNNLIYYSYSSTAAAAAGFVITCIINVLWLFYFGSDPNSPGVAFLDSFGDGENLFVNSRRLANQRNGNTGVAGAAGATGAVGAIGAIGSNGIDGTQRSNGVPGVTRSGSYTVWDNNRLSGSKENGNPFEGEPYSQELSGFENSQPEDPETTAGDVGGRESTTAGSATATAPAVVSKAGGISKVIPDSDYPILVRALYDYNASPDDINEMSFKNGEVFKVKDTTGNWWQGKNTNGDIGMCPSNYLEVIN